MEEKTNLYDISLIKREMVRQTINEVYEALKERGYDPINQLAGYLISGDPGYISNYHNAREKILSLDKNEIVAFLLKEYIRHAHNGA